MKNTSIMKNTFVARLIIMPLVSLVIPTLAAPSWAQDDDAELAKKLSNPIASLISVPLQSNWDFNIGPENAMRYTMNVQPVIPFSLNDDLNVIVRTVVPIIHAESPAQGVGDKDGLGDIVQSFFFSPKEPTSGGWIWGVGPVGLYASGTDDLSGDKWGAGPTAVFLKQDNGWTIGGLVNHIWSFSGPGQNDISATFLQPFVSYTTKTFTTFGLNTESTYDWMNSQWTVPINLTVSQLVKIGGMPIQFQIGGRTYVERPDGAQDWGLRFGVTFLFPK